MTAIRHRPTPWARAIWARTIWVLAIWVLAGCAATPHEARFAGPMPDCTGPAAPVATLTWLAVLGRLRLSVAFPFLGLSYVLMLPAARLLYREPISWIQVAGAALVCGGVVLIGSNR